MFPLLGDAPYILQQVVPGTVQALEKADTQTLLRTSRNTIGLVVHLEKKALWDINCNVAIV